MPSARDIRLVRRLIQSPKIRPRIRARLMTKRSMSPNGCWLWTGAVNAQGYGQTSAAGQRISVHRLAYVMFVGPVRKDLCVLHRCDTPGCFNPDHLFLGTHAQNSQDMVKKGRNRPPSGEAHHRAKLTWEDVDAIKASAEPTKDLANRYGVTGATISSIRLGRKWKGRPQARPHATA